MLLGLLGFFTAFSVNSQVRVMVKTDGVAFTAIENHTTWGTATSDLQDAIDGVANSPNGGEVWVAAGTYYPTQQISANEDVTSPYSREISFVMANNVTVMGGFTGTETTAEERPDNLVAIDNRVILSGNIGDPLAEDDNACHVVLFPLGVDDTAILEGVYITGGYANLSTSTAPFHFANRGGGVQMREGGIIRQSTITGNISTDGGGGAYMYQGGTITQSEVSNNNTNTIGAGILLNNGGTITYSLIHSNHANGQDDGEGGNPSNGAGVFFDSSSGIEGTLTHSIVVGNLSNNKGGGIGTYGGGNIINNLIINNEATKNGGGVFLQEGGTLTNNTIVSNFGDQGPGVYADTDGTLFNNVLWGNENPYNASQIVIDDATTVIDYTAIQGGLTGTNVTNVIELSSNNTDPGSGTEEYPEFRNPVAFMAQPLTTQQIADLLDADYKLNVTSALLDAGNSSATEVPLLDLEGQDRTLQTAVDIGAYETNYFDINGSVTSGTGTIDPTSALVLNNGEITFTLTPGSGYDVTEFLINGTDYTSNLVADGSEFTYTMNVTENLDATVTFDLANSFAEAAEGQFKLYPVPAQHIMYIDGITIQKVEIFSADGKLVKVIENTDLRSIPVADLKKGLYFISLTPDSGETIKTRFIKK